MIVPGKAQVVNGTVQIKAPFGFNSVAAVRLANYLTSSVLVSGLEGDNQSIHTLLSVQQMVYITRNVNTPATLMGTGTDTLAAVAAGIVVEWSTDPDHDFVGVYPAQLSVASQTVAQAIFTAGVPLVLTETALPVIFVARTGGGSPTKSTPIDVSAYASVEVTATPIAFPFGNKVGYYRTEDQALASYSVADYLVPNSGVFPPLAGTPITQLIPVTTKYMIFYNNNATTDVNFSVVGTNRLMPSVYDCDGANGVNLPAKYLLASTVMVVGTSYPLALVNNDAIVQTPNGECWMSFGLTTATAARGFLQYSYTAPDGTVQTYNLADTAEMHLDSPAGALSLYRPAVLPNMPNGQLSFNCRVAGTTNVFVTLVKNCG